MRILLLCLILLASCSKDIPPPPPPPAPPPPPVEIEKEALERETRAMEEGSSFLYDDSRYEPFTTTEDVLDQLETAAMAFNMPQTADIQETLLAQLRVDYHLSAVQLSETLISNEGHMIVEDIPVSKVISAVLVSPTLQIDPLTPVSQALSTRRSTEWLWSIKPSESGKHLVVLTVNAIVKVDGEQAERAILIKNETMEVTVTTSYMITTWLKQHWEWLLSGLIFPLIVWFWSRKNRKKKSNRS